MIFKNVENMAALLKKFSCFLLYGPNHEKISTSLEYISSVFPQHQRQYLDLSNIEQIDVLEQAISNNDIFALKKLFLISVPYPEKVIQKINKLNLKEIGETKIIFKATELKKNSKFRSLFEKSNSFACLPCYDNNQDEIRRTITQKLASENLEINENLLDFITIFFHQNKSNICNEIEKIIIFIKNGQRLNEKSFLKITNFNNHFDLESLIYAIVSGDLGKLDFLFEIKKGNNFPNITIINSLVNHLYKLIYFKEKYKLTGSKQVALKSIKPPIFFKYEAEFIDQSKFWSISHIEIILKKLFTAEKRLKTKANPDFMNFIFLSIAQSANRLKY